MQHLEKKINAINEQKRSLAKMNQETSSLEDRNKKIINDLKRKQ